MPDCERWNATVGGFGWIFEGIRNEAAHKVCAACIGTIENRV